MPFEDTKILELNQLCISDKGPFVIYSDLEYLIIKNDQCNLTWKNHLLQE